MKGKNVLINFMYKGKNIPKTCKNNSLEINLRNLS